MVVTNGRKFAILQRLSARCHVMGHRIKTYTIHHYKLAWETVRSTWRCEQTRADLRAINVCAPCNCDSTQSRQWTSFFLIQLLHLQKWFQSTQLAVFCMSQFVSPDTYQAGTSLPRAHWDNRSPRKAASLAAPFPGRQYDEVPTKNNWFMCLMDASDSELPW